MAEPKDESTCPCRKKVWQCPDRRRKAWAKRAEFPARGTLEDAIPASGPG